MPRSPWLDLAADADRVLNAVRARGCELLRVIADGREAAIGYAVLETPDVLRLAASGLERHPDALELEVFAVKGSSEGAILHRIVRLTAASARTPE